MNSPHFTPESDKKKDYVRSLLSQPWSREDYDFLIKFLGIVAAILLFGMRECRTREGVAASKRLKEDEMTLLRIENVRDIDSVRTAGLDDVIYDSLSFESRRVGNLLVIIDESTREYDRKISRLKFHNKYTDSLLTDHKQKVTDLRNFIGDFDNFKNRYMVFSEKVHSRSITPAEAIDSVFVVTPDERTRSILKRKARNIFSTRRYIVPYYQYVLYTFYQNIPATRDILLTDGSKALAVEGIGLQGYKEQSGLPFFQ